MQTRKDRAQEDLFVAAPLSQLIPEDHLFKKVDRILDLSWLHEEVRDCYCQDNGRASIDPESALRLMLAGFFEGIVHDRKLMRRAQTDLAFRWFAGYRLDETLPDHSSLTRIRQRWGAEQFRRIFVRTVQACAEAGLVGGKTVHVDATLIRADVSWASLTTEHVERVLKEHSEQEDDSQDVPPKGRRGRPRTKPRNKKKRSATDPEATMATSSYAYHLEPSYKQHTAVDDEAGVIVDVGVTTGEASEGQQLLEQLVRVEAHTSQPVTTVTADAGYAHSTNYAALEEDAIEAVIPPQREPRQAKRIPHRRFKYDGRHKVVRCPEGKTLDRRSRQANGFVYRARTSDCQNCSLKKRCLSEKAVSRSILIVDGYEALLRARRRWTRRDETSKRLYSRHRWRVEGSHGRAKTQHGLRRAVRRGLENVSIQVYLTAAAMNLKRLATAFRPLLRRFVGLYRLCGGLMAFPAPWKRAINRKSSERLWMENMSYG